MTMGEAGPSRDESSVLPSRLRRVSVRDPTARLERPRGNRLTRALALRRRLGSRRFLRLVLDHVRARLLNDPTLWPPPGYAKDRADAIYGEAFRRCYEYLHGARIEGDFLEFGTLRGYTARLLATLIREFNHQGRLHLYDSFEGLPDIRSRVDLDSYEVAVNKAWCFGQMAVESDVHLAIARALSRIIPVEQLQIVKGYYEETLPDHLPTTPVVLIHIDCDLYSSARYVLEKVLERGILQDGSVLLFDDFNCNRANPLMGERRALADAFDAQERFYYSPFFAYGWHGQTFFVHDRRAMAERVGEPRSSRIPHSD
jgi:hypothetical protein